MRRLFKRFLFLAKFRKSIPFLKDFFTSSEVKKWVKFVFIMAIVGYVLMPLDIIPDFLAGVGLVDDLAVVAFIMQLMVKVAPASIKEKHPSLPE